MHNTNADAANIILKRVGLTHFSLGRLLYLLLYLAHARTTLHTHTHTTHTSHTHHTHTYAFEMRHHNMNGCCYWLLGIFITVYLLQFIE